MEDFGNITSDFLIILFILRRFTSVKNFADALLRNKFRKERFLFIYASCLIGIQDTVLMFRGLYFLNQIDTI